MTGKTPKKESFGGWLAKKLDESGLKQAELAANPTKANVSII